MMPNAGSHTHRAGHDCPMHGSRAAAIHKQPPGQVPLNICIGLKQDFLSPDLLVCRGKRPLKFTTARTAASYNNGRIPCSPLDHERSSCALHRVFLQIDRREIGSGCARHRRTASDRPAAKQTGGRHSFPPQCQTLRDRQSLGAQDRNGKPH